MNVDALLPILSFGTIGAVIVFALISQQRTLKRLHDRNAPHSALARDRADPAFKPDARETHREAYANGNRPNPQETRQDIYNNR